MLPDESKRMRAQQFCRAVLDYLEGNVDAANIVRAARLLQKEHDGIWPDSAAELWRRMHVEISVSGELGPPTAEAVMAVRDFAAWVESEHGVRA